MLLCQRGIESYKKRTWVKIHQTNGHYLHKWKLTCNWNYCFSYEVFCNRKRKGRWNKMGFFFLPYSAEETIFALSVLSPNFSPIYVDVFMVIKLALICKHLARGCHVSPMQSNSKNMFLLYIGLMETAHWRLLTLFCLNGKLSAMIISHSWDESPLRGFSGWKKQKQN